MATGAAVAQISPMKNTPFQATRTIIADNRNGVSYTTTGMVARSSNGSTYQLNPDPKSGAPGTVAITDIPGQRHIILWVQRKIYTITPDPNIAAIDAPSPEVQQKNLESYKSMKQSHSAQGGTGVDEIPLGLRTQDGLVEVGRRTVMDSLPASWTIKEKVWEDWYSIFLGINVEKVAFDDTGRPDFKEILSNIKQAEPDPSLFQIPADYTRAPFSVPMTQPAAPTR
jgi:hypothetical protein